MGTLTIDKAGRILLPKPVRETMQLSAGDSLDFENSAEELVLRPSRGNGKMSKKHGVLVFHTGAPLTVETVDKVVRKLRGERDRRNSDKME